MSKAIIKFENDEKRLVYCKNDSYPTGLGFELLNIVENKLDINEFLDSERFETVNDTPHDIEYEYIVSDNGVHCQESWWADKSYHGGGIRHGGVCDLDKLREKIRLENEYSYRSNFVNPLNDKLHMRLSITHHYFGAENEELFVSTKKMTVRGDDIESLKNILKEELHIIGEDTGNTYNKLVSDVKKFHEEDSGVLEKDFSITYNRENLFSENIMKDVFDIVLSVRKY